MQRKKKMQIKKSCMLFECEIGYFSCADNWNLRQQAGNPGPSGQSLRNQRHLSGGLSTGPGPQAVSSVPLRALPSEDAMCAPRPWLCSPASALNPSPSCIIAHGLAWPCQL